MPALVAALCLALSGCQNQNSGASDLNNVAFSIHRQRWTISPPQQVDLLLVIDNGPSMVAKQQALLRSMQSLRTRIEGSWPGKYNVAVITTSMESFDCGECAHDSDTNCVNQTGEMGRFQDLVSTLRMQDGVPIITGVADPACRVIDGYDLDCLYDPENNSSVALVGYSGCRQGRGLEAIRYALSPALIESWNSNFLRADANLVVIVISDSEDCGKVGEVASGLEGAERSICSYAAKGIGPDGSTTHPDDPDQLPYEPTPISEYHQFLLSLKDFAAHRVRFGAIVGVEDLSDPLATSITYTSQDPSAPVLAACVMPDCEGEDCAAAPSTRYLDLADAFGIYGSGTGFIDTICQPDYFNSMMTPEAFVRCPRTFPLRSEILDPALVNLLVDDVPVSPYSCTGSSPGQFESCDGVSDENCSSGTCVQTWRFVPPSDPPDPEAPGGKIGFAEHYDPCDFITVREIAIELIYVTY
jgi:hypothetical protein